MAEKETKHVSMGMAILTLLIVAAIMAVGLAVLKIDTMVTFILSLLAVCIIAICLGMKLDDLQEVILRGFRKFALIGMILISVGMVVGTWMISGIVPSIIYYGLQLFSPSSFLALGFIICCIVSFFTGSSYAALGTMGVAFMAIGYGMDIHPGLTAGMAVSGAVFGDKMSPFSDTTNMAPAAAGTDIFLHIKSMIYTVTPSFIISLILYFVLGLQYDTASEESMASIENIVVTLDECFNISPFLLIVPVFTIVLVAKKVPAMVALVIGALLGIAAALIAQPQFTFNEVVTAMSSGFTMEFEDEALSSLLNRGGISAMMSTFVYCVFALELGELMFEMGVLSVILSKFSEKILKPCNLIITTLFSCLLTVMLTTSQYMAILLPGEVFRPSYDRAKVAPYVLSRTLEDGGTIFSFLVPWSAAAIYSTGVLNVPTLEYLPYAFLTLLCPVCAIICAFTGIGVFDSEDKKLLGKTRKPVA
ncbi:MAG: Na+/H+ antiporter NhaC [Anaerovoracaceae bacterium]